MLIGYGVRLDYGSLTQGSWYNPANDTIYISPEHVRNGMINAIVFAEELQHAIDEHYGRNAVAKTLILQRKLAQQFSFSLLAACLLTNAIFASTC